MGATFIVFSIALQPFRFFVISIFWFGLPNYITNKHTICYVLGRAA